jgi:hypothetical protein
MNGATNRKFWNFLEYQLRGSQNRCFALPNFSYGKTTLNINIPRLRPNFEIGSLVGRN